MLLLAVAVVCIGLGWHSAVTTESSPDADLRAAAASSSTTVATPGASAGSTAPRSVPGSSTAGASGASRSGPLVCVYNAVSVSGLAVEVSSSLESKGWRVSEPGNLQSASITENTVFYSPALRSQDELIAADLGGDASTDPRPSSFTQCRGGLAVVVITR